MYFYFNEPNQELKLDHLENHAILQFRHGCSVKVKWRISVVCLTLWPWNWTFK